MWILFFTLYTFFTLQVFHNLLFLDNPHYPHISIHIQTCPHFVNFFTLTRIFLPILIVSIHLSTYPHRLQCRNSSISLQLFIDKNGFLLYYIDNNTFFCLWLNEVISQSYIFVFENRHIIRFRRIENAHNSGKMVRDSKYD